MAQNIFGSSRRKLTLLYSIVMIIFLVVLIFAMHKTMEWSITSEQARELMDTASNVAEAQEYFNQHPEIVLDDTIAYKSTNDRLFFYVFDNEGRLLNFARASFRIEPFILDRIWGLESDVSSNNIDSYMKILRKKLDLGDGGTVIKTVRGVGYKLEAKS